MDLKMIFTFYLDSVVLGTEAVRQILVDHLLQGKLASMVASFDDFSFTVIPSGAGNNTFQHYFCFLSEICTLVD